MANLYFLKGSSESVNPPMGYYLLSYNLELETIIGNIVIQPKLPFLFATKRLNKALNSGVISQDVYNAIIENENEERQIYELNDDIEVDKEMLLDLVSKYGIANVNPEGTTVQIVQDIISQGYQIIKKI